MWTTVARLWRGEVPLRTAFWEYAIVYGLVINVLSVGGAFVSHAVGAPMAITATLFLLHIPYTLLVTVAVWRSARRYAGHQLWADLARAGVTVWAILAIFI
jgi:hypothetical protein